MQMGEMVRNLPEQAMAMFKWDEYGKALITALGFAPDSWIKSEEEVKEEQMAMQQEQMNMQQQQQFCIGMLYQYLLILRIKLFLLIQIRLKN